MNLKKTLAELALSAFLFVGLPGCSTINPQQDKQREFPEWLYSKINQDIEYILKRGNDDREISCRINNEDFYHAHVCLKSQSKNDCRISQKELHSDRIIFLYHSKEYQSSKNQKRNMFHNSDGSWEMLKDKANKGIYPDSRGLKGVTIYFGETREKLMENPIDESTIRKVGNYYFGISEVFPFLKE